MYAFMHVCIHACMLQFHHIFHVLNTISFSKYLNKPNYLLHSLYTSIYHILVMSFKHVLMIMHTELESLPKNSPFLVGVKSSICYTENQQN